MPAYLYGFAYSEKALAFLETIPVKFRRQIVAKVKLLANDPNPAGSKKLRGMTDGECPVYRIRSGDYRALYAVRENPQTIVVLDIDHRKDVYR